MTFRHCKARRAGAILGRWVAWKTAKGPAVASLLGMTNDRKKFKTPSMLKLVSWNVNSVNARLERVLAFLKREDPDVLCLQELKCLDDKFPLSQIQELGFHVCSYGQKAFNGVALLSKTEIQNPLCGFRDASTDTAARFISGVIRGITVLCAYVPNGQSVGSEKYVYKLEWLKRLREYLDKYHQPSEKLVIVGDFNIAPEDRDVHDPEQWRGKILFSEPEKEALRKVMEFGLEDTFRLHHKESGLFSWWDYRQLAFPKNLGLRIDLILATAPMAQRCRSAGIDRNERKGALPSDHAPVIAQFENERSI